MNLLYISLAEVLVFSDASVFSENIVNMKKMEKCTGNMSQAEQEAYVAESLNRALDEMEAHKKNGTKPMDARELLRRLR